jgi:predicted acyl esterase
VRKAGYDCVEWIAKQPWSDGKVGTWGGSALGRIQLETAIEKPPHLVCAVPLIAPLGQRYEDYYDGGILREAHVKMLDKLGFGVGAVVTRFPNADAPAWALAKRTTYKPESIEIPCLIITGWWDHHPASILSSFDDIRTKGGGKAHQSKLLIGPWDHVSIGVAQQGDLTFPKAAKASGEAAKAFLDYWLRGLDNGWDKTPDSRHWQIGDERWIEESPRGALRREVESVALGVGGAYTSDPANPSPTLGGANLPPLKHGPTDHSALDARKDQHVWKITKALQVNGSPELEFEATMDKESCDFIARLCEVRDGKPYLLADGASRVKTKPGEKTRVALTFPPTAITTHELRIYLTGTNWPRYERHEGVVGVTVHNGATLKVPTLR